MHGPKKVKREVEFAKAQGNILCDASLQTGRTHFAAIEKLYKHLEEVNTTIQSKGRGFYSTAQLGACKEEWEKIFKHDKELESIGKALKPILGISHVANP